jgi:predicted component of type VI protein secretion system
MRRRLVILEHDLPPREVVPNCEEVVIGRSPEGTVVLNDRSVSRRHAVIRPDGEQLVLEDSGSTYGTFVNDQPLESGQSVVLGDGDVLRLGGVRVVCRFEATENDIASATRDAAFAAQANARVLVLEGERVRRRSLAGAVTVVGSAPHCELRLSDRNAPPEQALIRAARGAFRVESRSATQPPLLNETQVAVVEPAPLPSNSVLFVSSAQLLFLYDFAAGGTPLDDPLARFSRRKFLRHVAEQSGISLKALRRLARDRRKLGQSLGEILVGKGLVTPVFWRVLGARLLERPSRLAPARRRRGGRSQR